MIQIGGTRTEVFLCGQWDKQLLRVRDRNIFINTNLAIFQAVVDHLNEQNYHVSCQHPENPCAGNGDFNYL